MLKEDRRKPPDPVAVPAFDDRFCKRPMMIQLPLFPKLVRPAC